MHARKRFDSQAGSSKPSKHGAANHHAALAKSETLRLARQFVARVGGMENARAALAMLTIMSRAA